MTSIPDCLAAFSVAAMTNTLDAESRGRTAIDSYVDSVPGGPKRQLAALHELYAAYLELALDSAAALAIKTDIENRIVEAAAGSQTAGAPDRHV